MENNGCSAGPLDVVVRLRALDREGYQPLTGALGARPINCDQVAWMLNAIERYLPRNDHPAVSRAREMQKYALLYELMEVANLHFEDGSAQHNGTPGDVRRFQFASKAAEAEASNNAQQKASNAIAQGREHSERPAGAEGYAAGGNGERK